MKTPIAYIIFNRPRHTSESFSVIRAHRPPQLFIIADGPRAGHPTDAARCEEVRKIVEQIDWPCEVHRNYAPENMGLKQRVSSGLDLVFGQVDRAIILEDDCVPNSDFFSFCDIMLDRYEHDERVSVITGNNFQNGRRRGKASYYFSKYNHCWGWATWRRAWDLNDGEIEFWQEWKASKDWRKKMPDAAERRYWTKIFDRVQRGDFDTWDYPWTASVWYRGGLTATPNANLVTNIGIGPDGTHTVKADEEGGVPVVPLGPLTHPHKVELNKNADRYTFDHHFGGKDQRFFSRMWRALRRRLNGLITRRKNA